MSHLLGSLALCLLATTASAAGWSDDPTQNTPVVTRSGDQALPKSAATRDGGRWVAWFDNSSGNYDVYAQRYDSKGHTRFATGGLRISGHPQSSSLVDWSLIVDASDNLVVAFTDIRGGNGLDVHAYRVNSNGTFLWGPDGVSLSSNADFEANPMVTETSTGDFAVVWGRFGAVSDVRLQRISRAGVPQLAADGVSIASEAGASPGFADVVAGSGGDVIVSWLRDTSFSTSVRHVRAQAFTPAGTPAWPAPVEVYTAANLPLGYAPQLLADDAGGAVLCWHVSNPSRSFLFDAYVQRLDSSGSELLPLGGLAVSAAAGTNHLAPRAAFNASTGHTIVSWTETNAAQSESGWFAQQVDDLGNLMWGPGGVELLPVNASTKYLAYLEAAGDGAIVAMGWAPGGGFGQDEIVATRLDAAGAEVWGSAVGVSTVSSGKSTRLSLSVSADDEAVVFWEDDRGGDDDLYGQNVDADGDLGATFLSVDVTSVSMGAGGTATLSLDAGAAFGGKRYAVLGSNTGTSPGITAFGAHLDLNPGPYFNLTRNQPTHPLFGDFQGRLDARGRATATFQVPPGSNPALAGTTLAHAFAVWQGGAIVLASESVSFELVP